MKTLLMLRHAEAAGTGDDFERPLTPRGRERAVKLTARMQDHGLRPSRVLCSAARRAVETCAVIAKGLDVEVPTTVDRDLYLAAPERILSAIRSVPDDADSVLLIGHNPGLQALARELVGSGARQALARLGPPFPAAGLAVIDFATERWADAAPDGGKLVLFLDPRDPA